MPDEPINAEEPAPRRRRRRRNKWQFVMIPVVTLMTGFATWQVIVTIQTVSGRSKTAEAQKEMALTAPGKAETAPPPRASAEPVAKPVKSLLDVLPGTATDVPAGAPADMPPTNGAKLSKAEADQAAAAALESELKKKRDNAKAAAAELGDEMKKKQELATTAATEATAKDIGVRSQVVADFRVITGILNKYFLATSEVEIEPLVRAPDLMMGKYREWTARGRKLEPAPQLRPSTKFITTDRFFITAVPLANATSRLAVFEKFGEGYKLDWESFVGWCDQTFEDLPRLASGHQSLMRVNAQRSASVPPFKTRPGSMAFTLTHPDETASLNALLPAELVIGGGKTVRYLTSMQKSSMVTLKVFMDDECRAYGWVKIAAVPNMGWVSDVDITGGSALLGN